MQVCQDLLNQCDAEADSFLDHIVNSNNTYDPSGFPRTEKNHHFWLLHHDADEAEGLKFQSRDREDNPSLAAW